MSVQFSKGQSKISKIIFLFHLQALLEQNIFLSWTYFSLGIWSLHLSYIYQQYLALKLYTLNGGNQHWWCRATWQIVFTTMSSLSCSASRLLNLIWEDTITKKNLVLVQFDPNGNNKQTGKLSWKGWPIKLVTRHKNIYLINDLSFSWSLDDIQVKQLKLRDKECKNTVPRLNIQPPTT